VDKRAISLIALATFSAASMSCWANLSDTLEQSIARYGQPISVRGVIYAFKIDTFEIEEIISQGKGATREVVWKPDRAALSESEKEAVLQANAGTGKWRSENQHWVRTSDLGIDAVAMYYPNTPTEQNLNVMVLGLIDDGSKHWPKLANP